MEKNFIGNPRIVIEKRNMTFAELLVEVDKLFPNGKVANFCLEMCNIREIPNKPNIIFNGRYVDVGKPIINKFFFKRWRLVIQKKRYRQTFLGKYEEPTGLILINNVFTVKGYKPPGELEVKNFGTKKIKIKVTEKR